ncbi:MAG TPA: glycosyltransferase [Pyrinomonadaceae bacterium]|nr:glycosyltransferase [Pyrinomonadaceae bacterium]
MPNVSVIIPTRNRCRFLSRAIESAQLAGTDVEIIVVDVASDDATTNVCAALADRGLIHYVRTSRPLAPAAARNAGLLSATAPYISFLDDDDLRLPGSLDKQVVRLESEPEAGMIYGRAFYGDENGEPAADFYPGHCPEGDLFWELMRWNFIPCPTVIFRRTCLTRVGLLDDDIPGIEDWDLWVRIAELYPVLSTPEPVAIWRRSNPSSQQFTSRGEKLHKTARALHRDKWLRLPRASAASSDQRRKATHEFKSTAAQQLVWEAASNLKAKHLPGFARVAFAGARMYPVGVSRKIFAHLCGPLRSRR